MMSSISPGSAAEQRDSYGVTEQRVHHGSNLTVNAGCTQLELT